MAGGLGAITAPRQIRDNAPVVKRKFSKSKIKRLAKKL
jgi:hypothetical protein